MSELQNPLFDEEKEFLERKKLEYERALRGDVKHIKEQSTKVGKVALVGAGLVGGIWFITKVFSGKKKRKRFAKEQSSRFKSDYDELKSDHDHDYEFGTGYFANGNGNGNGNGKRRGSPEPYKSAADSAQVFTEHHEHTHESDDLGFGSVAVSRPAAFAVTSTGQQQGSEEEEYDIDDFEEDPFQELPYDDSRRLPASRAFEGDGASAIRTNSSRTRMVGAVLQAFLQSDTGKVLVAQVAAVALALVTKKVGEFFPPTKNSDLATSPGSASIATGVSPVASSVSPVPSDALNPSQSV